MDKSLTDNLIRNNQAILCGGLFIGPRLTPTGKISHAKTRVYTQRYRREWEQMPDFRGWLTSVPNQATRAYCTFCKKNLHAHRLSLLKHTCTMKHQRAALMAQNEMNAQQANAVKIAEIEAGYEEDVDPEIVSAQKESDRECEEDNEDFEYVVETLEMEDDELNETRCKESHEDDVGNTEDYDEETNHLHASMEDDDETSMKRKIKIERQDPDCRDTLAEAMAHVHGEYLDGTEEQVNVEMEMIVEEDGIIRDAEQDISLNSIEDEGDATRDNDNEDVKCLISVEKSSAEDDSSESETSPARSLHEIEKSFKNVKDVLNNTKINVAGSQTTFGTPISIPSGQTKTFKLNSGKTVTLKAGTQYVLSNLKGNDLTEFLMADRRHGAQSDATIKSEQLTIDSSTKKPHPYAAVAGTSQQSSSQKSTTRSGETKKPCISTHVLDTSKGVPIGGLQVSLYKLMDGRWTFLNESNTSPNGRCNDLVDNTKTNFTAGRYKMHFDVDKYFTLRRIETMYPFIEIVFDVKNPTGNYHIPVLLSPFGYTTYRGTDS